MNQSELDMAGLNLNEDAPAEEIPEEPVKPPAAVEKLIEEARAALTAQEKGEKRSLSMVVIGTFTSPSPSSLLPWLTRYRTCRCGQIHHDGTIAV